MRACVQRVSQAHVTVAVTVEAGRYVYWADAGATTLKSMEQTEKPAPGAAK